MTGFLHSSSNQYSLQCLTQPFTLTLGKKHEMYFIFFFFFSAHNHFNGHTMGLKKSVYDSYYRHAGVASVVICGST